MKFVRRLLGQESDKAEPHAPVPAQAEAQSQVEQSTDTNVQNAEQTGQAEPCPPPQVLPFRGSGLRVGYASDVGQVRDHNEDTAIVFQGTHLGYDTGDPFGFFVVTDGMGGHQAGEVASSLAARVVTHQVLHSVYLPFLLNETPGADTATLKEILENAVEKANEQVHKHVPGGGTTLTCALILGQRAYIAHVGDSRAYLLTDHDIRQLTEDHSFVNRLIKLGELSRDEAAVHPQRHVLYRAVGQGEQLDIDTYQQTLAPGSRLLLCSDGLSGLLSEERIGEIIASASTPQQACQRLVEAANHAGGPDNITAVMIEMPPE